MAKQTLNGFVLYYNIGRSTNVQDALSYIKIAQSLIGLIWNSHPMGP